MCNTGLSDLTEAEKETVRGGHVLLHPVHVDPAPYEEIPSLPQQRVTSSHLEACTHDAQSHWMRGAHQHVRPLLRDEDGILTHFHHG